MSLSGRLHARFGDFWWYAALMFLACRTGDVVQAFIGLWLVPHYVGQAELGAALPLMQMASMVGLPLSVLVVPFSRWLTIYAARGELGKVKRLLSLAFKSVAAMFVLSLAAAHFILPLAFERLRIAEGSLGLLILAAGLAGPLSSVFNNALQGLKRFKAMSFISAVSAPARLIVMLVAMPFRALSGYMLGQCAAPAVMVAVSCRSLKGILGGAVKSVPLGRSDVREMVRYTIPVAFHMTVCTITGTWLMVLFRQRLPEVESAAFYIISRLAEIAAYAGMTLSVVAFPLAAEEREKGTGGRSLLRKLVAGTLIPGLAVAALFAVFGEWILGVVPLWEDYVPYATLLSLFTLRTAVSATAGVFVSFEMAMGRFRFMWYYIPCVLVETMALVVLTGAGVFRGVLPDSAVDWMESVRAARLEFFVWWLLGASFVTLGCEALHALIRAKRMPKG